MLDNPQRTVTPVWLQLPTGLPANAGNVRVRIDWNDEGPAGSVRLWNWDVIDALRNPAPVNQGGNRILPGNSYELSNLRYDAETGRFVIYQAVAKGGFTCCERALNSCDRARLVDRQTQEGTWHSGNDAGSCRWRPSSRPPTCRSPPAIRSRSFRELRGLEGLPVPIEPRRKPIGAMRVK